MLAILYLLSFMGECRNVLLPADKHCWLHDLPLIFALATFRIMNSSTQPTHSAFGDSQTAVTLETLDVRAGCCICD